MTASEPVDGPWVLPDGWRWERLGNLADRIAAKHQPGSDSEIGFVGMDAIAPNTMRVTKVEPFSSMRSAASAFEPGDVLYGRLRPYLNKVWRASFAGACSGELLVIRPNADLDAKYLALTLHSKRFVDFAASCVSGDRPRIDFAAMADFELPVPPVSTQQLITDRIDELFSEVDDGEAALERARGDLATWRKALLKAALTGELTTNWRAANRPTETGADLLARILAERRARWLAEPRNKGKRYDEPIGVDASGLPNLPPGWTWAGLGQIASEQERSFQSGPFGSALLHSEFQSSGKLVIGIDNVKSGQFSLGSNHRISDGKFIELNRFRARPEDVLITVMATIGRTCVVPDDIEDAIITKHVYRISLDRKAAASAFVMNAFRASPSTVTHLFGKVQGQTRPGLNKSILEQTPIPLAPLDEQIEVLRRVAQTTASAEGLLDNLEKGEAATLRQSILAAAFRGDLVQ